MKKKAYKDLQKAEQEIANKFPKANLNTVGVIYGNLPIYIRKLAEQEQFKVPQINTVIGYLQKDENYKSLGVYVLQDLVANYYKQNNLRPGQPIKTSTRKIGMPRISSRETK